MHQMFNKFRFAYCHRYINQLSKRSFKTAADQAERLPRRRRFAQGAFFASVAGLTLSSMIGMLRNDIHLHNTDKIPHVDGNISQTVSSSDLPTFRPQNPDGRPHLVILGSGWGAVGVLQHLDPGKYVVTVLSPSNYFLFTPLLPSATVGTIDPSSLIEPMRNILEKYGHSYCYKSGASASSANFLEAEAVDLEFQTSPGDSSQKRVKCRDGNGREFWVSFDKLVIAVGSKSITFGVPGVDEHCHFLKNAQHAKEIKSKIISNFELASCPTVSDEERQRLLSFVVCGGGPTGVEFASELYDFVRDDLCRFFPSLKEQFSVSIIQSQDHILNTYDERISKLTEEKFKRDGIEVLRNCRVVSVDEKQLQYRDSKGNITSKPFGLCLWTTYLLRSLGYECLYLSGVGLQNFTEKLVEKLEAQTHSRSLIVDKHLLVKGVHQEESPGHCSASIWAIGDCCTVELPRFIPRIMEIFRSGTSEESNSLSYDEFRKVSEGLKQEFPLTRTYLVKLKKLFKEFDVTGDDRLDFDEFERMLRDLDKKLKPFPSTAQVASQQGRYVAEMLNWQYDNALESDRRYSPFVYRHLGSMAYIGSDMAIFDSGKGFISSDRFGTFWLWKSVYLSELVSLRQRVNLAYDWMKTFLFGRDISNTK